MRTRRPTHCPHRAWVTAACLAGSVLAATTAASAQTEDSAAGLRLELAVLRAELQDLRAELEDVKAHLGGVPPSGGAGANAPRPQGVVKGHRSAGPVAAAAAEAAQRGQLDPQALVGMLQTQVAELAQTKVGTESRLPVRLFGTIHSHVFANSGHANWLDNPNLLTPAPADGHSGTFSAALRQTRLGLVADGPTIGGFRSSANLAVDFLGGIPGFQTGQVMGLPRILVAFARLENERTAFVIGQDHVVLAPRDPTSLAAFAFPLLFRSGNLYLRAPQLRVEHALAPFARIQGGIVAPIAGDVPGEDYRFVPPALAGERSRRPGLQARFVLAAGGGEAPRSGEIGLSGHYGWERRPATLAESWAAAVDFSVRRDRVGLAGELYVGDNIDAFGGALGLDARAAGGWAELQLFASERLTFAAGTGLDRVRRAQLSPLPRRRSRTAFTTVILSLTPELQTSFEYRWLGMLPGEGAERRNHHVDWVFAYRF